MSWINSNVDNPDDNVVDCWEELADLDMTVPEPPSPLKIEKKVRKKTEEKKPEKDKNIHKEPSQSISVPVTVLPSSPIPKVSSSPEIGKVRILKRDPAARLGGPQKPSAPAPAPPTKTYEERQRLYNEARMRIFGCLDDDDTDAISDTPQMNQPAFSASNKTSISNGIPAQNGTQPYNYNPPSSFNGYR